MTKREKVLAAAVGVSLALVAAMWLLSRGMAAFESRHDDIAKLQQEVEAKQSKVRRGSRAKAQIEAWKRRSLSSDMDRARTDYRVWLDELVTKAGLEVRPAEQKKQGNLYVSHTFQITGESELRKLIQFLHDFYSAGYLHRINTFVANPQPDKKELAVSIKVDVLSLVSAPKETGDGPPPADQPLGKDVPAYAKTILGRNFFFPANNPPRISSVGTQRGHPNKPMSFTVKGSDPDKDTLTYQLVSTELDGAKIDSKSGEFRWTPAKLGSDYVAVIQVTDSGNPPLSVEEKVRLSVVDPPPVPKEDPFARDDPARDAKVTSIVGPVNELQVWVLVPRGLGDQAKMLHLKPGDNISVGSFTGVLKMVRDREADFELKDGRRVTVRWGQTLVSSGKSPGTL